jgi:hypothetical protein
MLGLASSTNRPANLPTWCPNLNSPYPEKRPLQEVRGFKAGWSDSRLPQHNVSFVADSDNIKIPSSILDHVKALVDLGKPFDLERKKEWGPDGTAAKWLTREERCLEA